MPGVVVPPAIMRAAGAVVGLAEGVTPGVARVVPTEGAVTEPDVVAAGVAVAEDEVAGPVDVLGKLPVAVPLLEAAGLTMAGCTGAATAVEGLADVTGPAFEFAMTCALGFTGV